MSSADEILSELLIAQLLEEDLRNIDFAKHAEKMQIDQLLVDSSKGKRIPGYARLSTDDQDIAVHLLVDGARVSSDALCAQALQHSTDVSNVASQQLAQRLAAEERKFLLDAEFAKRLQAADDGGEIDTDDVRMHDAERVLGRELIDSLMGFDMNDKGKGKRVPPESTVRSSKRPEMEQPELSASYGGKSRQPGVPAGGFASSKLYPTCGICMDPFQVTDSPLRASLSANSSSRLAFGLRLPCPGEHAYCMSCLSHYIKTKLEPEVGDVVNTTAVVFPIRCPECPKSEWEQGIQDDIAMRLLDQSTMVQWHHQRILDSLPRTYCPNPRCSALVQVDEDSDEPQAPCPACQSIVCIPCRTLWHSGMSCEEYQSLPLNERSPEDQLTLQLAKAKNWRRCPNCSAIVELTQGCHHITCRCTKEFCFKCGSSWDIEQSRCTSNPPCALWDEDLLLSQRERDREDAAMPVQLPPPHAAVGRGEFSWLDDPGIVCGRHWFTTAMLSNLTCGYCSNRLNSLADLQYHLSHVRYHRVYACCGRLFKQEEDFDRHTAAYPRRFGEHIYQITR